MRFVLQLARDLAGGSISSIVRIVRSANFAVSKIALFEGR